MRIGRTCRLYGTLLLLLLLPFKSDSARGKDGVNGRQAKTVLLATRCPLYSFPLSSSVRHFGERALAG